jgi:UDP-glucuronate decarboxylase
LAKTNLGWEPNTSLRHGLEKTIAWFRAIQWDEYRAPTPNF